MGTRQATPGVLRRSTRMSNPAGDGVPLGTPGQPAFGAYTSPARTALFFLTSIDNQRVRRYGRPCAPSSLPRPILY